MNKKLSLLVIPGLALALAVPLLTGCSGSPTTAAQAPNQTIQISQQPQGLWVNGTGEVTVTPDVAVVNLGIVSQETTVAAAQSKAADAMTKVMKALTDNKVAQKDIQTGSYSIYQRTRWDDQKQTEVVTGYQVSNMVTVKIRDTGKVGAIIDAVAQAGGDLTRINGISFSVDDPSKYYGQAREKAMADAKDKAVQTAKLAGVTLGKPTYITESVQSPIVYDSYRSSMPVPAPAPAMVIPPISAGENKITITVQVAYSTLP